MSPKKGRAGEVKQCLDLGLDKKKVVVENLGGEGHEVEGVKSPGEEQVEGQGTPPPHIHYYAPRPVIKKAGVRQLQRVYVTDITSTFLISHIINDTNIFRY